MSRRNPANGTYWYPLYFLLSERPLSCLWGLPLLRWCMGTALIVCWTWFMKVRKMKRPWGPHLLSMYANLDTDCR